MTPDENKMQVEILRRVHPDRIKPALSATFGRQSDDEPLDIDLWRKLVCAEHSPIRIVRYQIVITDIPYWLAMELRTHKIGAEFFIQSQRRVKDRGKLPQEAPVRVVMDANVQALINIAKVRLCRKAHILMRKMLRAIRNSLAVMDSYDRVVSNFMAPKCGWYGFCPEIKPCGKGQAVSVCLNMPDYKSRFNAD